MTSYWPWWLGGVCLAAAAVLHPALTGHPLGVSGALAQLVRRARERFERDDAPAPGSTDACGGDARQDHDERLADFSFLAAMAVGGVVALLVSGGQWGQEQLASEYHRLFGSGIGFWSALFFGGLLVGLGTRMSGGCTSGHGLSGCGRLQPASLAATATFFGVAIVVSLLLERLLS